MSDEKKILDNLFKDKLQEEVDFDTDENWGEMDALIQKKKFYVFTLKNFNIYYALLIAMGFVLGTAAFINMLLVNNGVNSVNTKTIIYDTTIINRETILIDPSENNKTNSSKDKNNTLTDPKSTENSSASKNELLPVVKDTIKTENKTAGSLEKDAAINPVEKKTEPVIVKRKRTVYVTEYDTIMRYDTLKTKKRKK